MIDPVKNLITRGYALIEKFFPGDELDEISRIVFRIHERWQGKYDDPDSVNSAYLTGTELCPVASERRRLFEFIAQAKLVSLAESVFGRKAFFLNTQLFFNPGNREKRPYWHRDIQYLGISEAEQKKMIGKNSVLHFRVPLANDPGLEIIPGSHDRWDTELERDVRLESGGRKNSDDLPDAISIPHGPGDLLVFPAHLIHRGRYGLERKSFDVLYTDFPEQEQLVRRYQHFPDESIKSRLDNGRIFNFARD